jgi:DNA-directed RNA polymerase subunit RPC12/RpoP
MQSKAETIRCPRCRVVSVVFPTAEWAKDYTVHATIYMCSNCQKPLFFERSFGEVTVFPLEGPPIIDKSIPPQVAIDYKEALLCFSIKAPKATVAMCRRALQSSVINEGAGGDKLVEQIDDLHKQGKITEKLKEWAHEIRLTGNLGAHPDKDGLVDVTMEDAEQILKFAEAYFNYVYVMPKQVEDFRKKKKSP